MAVLGLNSFGLGSTFSSGLNFESPESLAEKIYQQQQQHLLEQYPNRVTLLIEVSGKNSGNLYTRDNAARTGLIYGTVSRIIKGKEILYPTASGEIGITSLADIIKDRIAMDLGLTEGAELVNRFHRIPPDPKTGSRRAEIEFAFPEEVFINSESTIITGGLCVGDFKTPQGDMIGSQRERDSKSKQKKADSASYRKSERDKYKSEREQQLLAQNDIEAEAPSEEKVPEVSAENIADMFNT